MASMASGDIDDIVIEDSPFKTLASVDVLTNLRGEVEDLMLNVNVNVECSML